jgi:hypothetical protein
MASLDQLKAAFSEMPTYLKVLGGSAIAVFFLIGCMILWKIVAPRSTDQAQIRPAPATEQVAQVTQRLPDWKMVVDWAKGKTWGKDLRDIPATVVDKAFCLADASRSGTVNRVIKIFSISKERS